MNLDPDFAHILDNLADDNTGPPTLSSFTPCEIKVEPIFNRSDSSPTQFLVGGTSSPESAGIVDERQLSVNHRQINQHAPDQPNFQQPRRKSKKGPAPKLFGNEKCKICESRATGFHYNVLSCEACKVRKPRKFFFIFLYAFFAAEMTLYYYSYRF